MTRTKSTFWALLAVLLSPMAANAGPILTSLGGDQYQISFDPISFKVTTAGQVASVVFEDFYTTVNPSCGTYNSGTAQASLNGGPVQNLIGNVCTGAYDNLNAVDGNDLLVTIFSGFFSTYGTVAVGDILTISTLNYVFTLGGLDPSANIGPFDTFLVNNSFVRVSESGMQVPEPGTLALLGLGLLGMGAARRKKA